jgi:hypothetical protein
MRIGVVLCTYNGERYLQEQLDSILAQTRLPDAMLVQDDGSTDATISILDSFAALAPFAVDVIRNRENLGFVRNFERGIARCSADIIVLSDQDDYWRRDKLRKMEQLFASDDRVAVVFSDAEIVDESRVSFGYGLFHALGVTPAELAKVCRGDLLFVLLKRNIVAGATMALRADRKQQLLPIADGAYHDEWIALVAAAFNEIRYCPEPLIQYRQHSTNQFGGRRVNVIERLRSLLRPRWGKDELRRLQVAERLQERLSNLGVPAAIVTEVKAKLAHQQIRASLPACRRFRVRLIVRELSSGRYSKYSAGWRSAVKDLVSADVRAS